ncbi:MAG: hypothetical protein VW397_05685, partial [Candidatus Margulisiibacteriota bacterium]
VILDCLKLGKKCIVCVIKGNKNFWDWTRSLDRDVMKDLVKDPNIYICRTINQVTDTINRLVLNQKKDFLNVSNYSKKIFHELTN